MEVNSIERGVVIDHVRAGFAMKALEYLSIDVAKNTVAIIMNAVSQRHGKKDIIKIENVTDIDLTALGLLDHNATVNIIEGGKITRKIKLTLPEKVEGVIKCKNPRCVTSIEPAIPHVFRLVGPSEKGGKEYRCQYCDEIVRV